MACSVLSYILIILHYASLLRALPERQGDAADNAQELGLDSQVVKEVEKRHGKLPWVREPRNGGEGKLEKRAWIEPCGGGVDAYYYISNRNRVFQMHCNATWSNQNPIQPDYMVPNIPDLSSCIDRCAYDPNFNGPPASPDSSNGCRIAVFDANLDCKMLRQDGLGSGVPAGTYLAFGSYVTGASGCVAGEGCFGTVTRTTTVLGAEVTTTPSVYSSLLATMSPTETADTTSGILSSASASTLPYLDSSMTSPCPDHDGEYYQPPGTNEVYQIECGRFRNGTTLASSVVGWAACLDDCRAYRTPEFNCTGISWVGIYCMMLANQSEPLYRSAVGSAHWVGVVDPVPLPDASAISSTSLSDLQTITSSPAIDRSSAASVPTSTSTLSYLPQSIGPQCPDHEGAYFRSDISHEIYQIECGRYRQGARITYPSPGFRDCLNQCYIKRRPNFNCTGLFWVGQYCVLLANQTTPIYDPTVWGARLVGAVDPVPLIEGSSSASLSSPDVQQTITSSPTVSSDSSLNANPSPTTSGVFLDPTSSPTCPENEGAFFRAINNELYMIECGRYRDGSRRPLELPRFQDCINECRLHRYSPFQQIQFDCTGVFWIEGHCELLSGQNRPVYEPLVWGARRWGFVEALPPKMMSSSAAVIGNTLGPESTSSTVSGGSGLSSSISWSSAAASGSPVPACDFCRPIIRDAAFNSVGDPYHTVAWDSQTGPPPSSTDWRFSADVGTYYYFQPSEVYYGAIASGYYIHIHLPINSNPAPQPAVTLSQNLSTTLTHEYKIRFFYESSISRLLTVTADDVTLWLISDSNLAWGGGRMGHFVSGTFTATACDTEIVIRVAAVATVSPVDLEILAITVEDLSLPPGLTNCARLSSSSSSVSSLQESSYPSLDQSSWTSSSDTLASPSTLRATSSRSSQSSSRTSYLSSQSSLTSSSTVRSFSSSTSSLLSSILGSASSSLGLAATSSYLPAIPGSAVSLIRNGNFEVNETGYAPPWTFFPAMGNASILFQDGQAIITPLALTTESRTYLYQAATVQAGSRYSLSIDIYPKLAPEDECQVSYIVSGETLRTTGFDSSSDTHVVDSLAGTFKSNANFFSIRVSCTGHSPETLIGLANVRLDTED